MTDSAPPGATHSAEPIVDVRDLDGFMLNVERLLASELWALSTGEEFKAAVGLWCRAWKQIPAGSLPNDERVLASFAGVTMARWAKIRGMAMRGFMLGADGRLHHRVLIEDAKRAFARKTEYKAERDGALARKHREREERAAMFDALRKVGVVPEWNIPTRELRALAVKYVPAPVTAAGVTVTALQGQGGDRDRDRDEKTGVSDVSSGSDAPRRPPRTANSDRDLSPTWSSRHPELVEPMLASFRGENARTIDVLRYFRVKLDSRGQPLEGEWQRETNGQIPEEVALVFMNAPESAIALPSQYRSARKAFEITEAPSPKRAPEGAPS